ncbi:MAG: hypothetical protein DRP02_02355 [Candidatus Gerdarchaeota archaeon]|nr:MAG: hypothetical protein DRP02_02355 [Candidatus Gerdarchaeota archaeon]
MYKADAPNRYKSDPVWLRAKIDLALEKGAEAVISGGAKEETTTAETPVSEGEETKPVEEGAGAELPTPAAPATEESVEEAKADDAVEEKPAEEEATNTTPAATEAPAEEVKEEVAPTVTEAPEVKEEVKEEVVEEEKEPVVTPVKKADVPEVVVGVADKYKAQKLEGKFYTGDGEGGNWKIVIEDGKVSFNKIT